MAPHSSTLAWKILWMEQPGRLQSMGSQSWTWPSDFTFTFHFHALEKEMATHSSALAWRIPGMEEPGGLPSMGSHRVILSSWSDLAAAAAAYHKSYPLVGHWWSFIILPPPQFWSQCSHGCLFLLCALVLFSSVQLLSRVRLFATPWIAACQASLSITNSWSLPKLISIELVMPSSHLILCRPLLLLPPIPSSIRVFSNESTLHIRWPRYLSFSFIIILSKEIPELISFRMDWLDLLAVQGTLKSLLQHHSSKASNLWHSAFFTVQLSHPYMTTGKTIALTRWTFSDKVMSLLLNMLSKLDITFLPRSISVF